MDTDLTAVEFNRSSNPLIGVVTGKNGTTLRTANGGLTFAATGSRTNQDIHALWRSVHETNNGVCRCLKWVFDCRPIIQGELWGQFALSGRANDYTAVQFTTDLTRISSPATMALILIDGKWGQYLR
jgi:hypothetical protein